jgi:hypothetical protein
MSRIKELKNDEKNNINIVDLLSILCTKKTKYVETLLRVIKNEKKHKQHIKEIKKFLIEEFNISEEDIKNIPEDHLLFYHTFMENMIGLDDLKSYQKFCDYNERNLISNNDLSTYKSFLQIKSSISIAEIKEFEKELEGQIIELLKDDEWLILKPLTHQSSKKYGSNTKWCTVAENSPEYFDNYTRNGILIYIINMKTGKKTAVHKSFRNNEITYWNQLDKKISQDETNLPFHIINIIQKSLKDNRSNSSFLNKNGKKIPDNQIFRRNNRIRIKDVNDDITNMTSSQIKIKR